MPDIKKLSGRAIRIIVGPDKKDIYVHESLLQASSEYFGGMLRGQWEEAKRGVVILDDIDAEIFLVYQSFLYFAKVETKFGAIQEDQIVTEHERLVDCYVLGDRFRDNGFKNAVIDAINASTRIKIDGLFRLPSGHTTTKIYMSTAEGSPLRRLIVDQHVTRGNSSWMHDAGVAQFHPQFLYDLSVAFMDDQASYQKANKITPDSVPCKYHEHGANSVCCVQSCKYA